MLVSAGKTAFKVATFLFFAQTEADGNLVVSVGGACTWAPGCRRHRCPLKNSSNIVLHAWKCQEAVTARRACARANAHLRNAPRCPVWSTNWIMRAQKTATRHAGLKLPLGIRVSRWADAGTNMKMGLHGLERAARRSHIRWRCT